MKDLQKLKQYISADVKNFYNGILQWPTDAALHEEVDDFLLKKFVGDIFSICSITIQCCKVQKKPIIK